MAKQPNRKANSRNPADWQKFEFVEIQVGKDEQAEFKARYAKEPAHFLDELSGLVRSGYKFSATYDDTNNCVIASLSCREPSDPNFNYVLSARAGDIWEASALVMYKHLYLCDDGDWGGDTRTDARSWG